MLIYESPLGLDTPVATSFLGRAARSTTIS